MSLVMSWARVEPSRISCGELKVVLEIRNSHQTVSEEEGVTLRK